MVHYAVLGHTIKMEPMGEAFAREWAPAQNYFGYASLSSYRRNRDLDRDATGWKIDGSVSDHGLAGG